MADPLLPPNPCLIAILLVAQYKHQPRLVFHYPPKPGEDDSLFKTYLRNDLADDDSSTSNDDESASSAGAQSPVSAHRSERGGDEDAREVDIEETGSGSPEKYGGLRRPPKWNDIFGLDATNLAKLLCPLPNAHKKRFEMNLDDKAFLGWPVFSKDGVWRKKKKKKKTKVKNRRSTDGPSNTESGGQDGKTSLQVAQELEGTSGQETDFEGGKEHHSGSGKSTDMPKDTSAGSPQMQEDSSKQQKSDDEPVSKNILSMFHVVFVLEPPPLEYHLRMGEMYDYVVKKFSRALKWEQARSNYVSREISTITDAKRFGKSSSMA